MRITACRRCAERRTSTSPAFRCRRSRTSSRPLATSRRPPRSRTATSGCSTRRSPTRSSAPVVRRSRWRVRGDRRGGPGGDVCWQCRDAEAHEVMCASAGHRRSRAARSVEESGQPRCSRPCPRDRETVVVQSQCGADRSPRRRARQGGLCRIGSRRRRSARTLAEPDRRNAPQPRHGAPGGRSLEIGLARSQPWPPASRRALRAKRNAPRRATANASVATPRRPVDHITGRHRFRLGPTVDSLRFSPTA